MTEQTMTDEVEGNDVETAVETVESVESADETTEGKKGSSEAAKWRVRFREAEATIASLKARVDDMQAQEVSRLATGPGRLHDGSDLLAATRLGDLLDDEGNVDPEVVEAKLSALIEKKPHLAKPAFDGEVGIGQKNAATGATWADVIGG